MVDLQDFEFEEEKVVCFLLFVIDIIFLGLWVLVVDKLKVWRDIKKFCDMEEKILKKSKVYWLICRVISYESCFGVKWFCFGGYLNWGCLKFYGGDMSGCQLVSLFDYLVSWIVGCCWKVGVGGGICIMGRSEWEGVGGKS